ncbi:MAG TPA: hypothetical protein VN709_04355 [Terriglobales bacterium]|nr:hypothetical protein [Terriglobales bacterium]
MPKRRKPKKLTADKLVREMARARVGAPPPKRVLEDKRRREKHKPDLEEQQ